MIAAQNRVRNSGYLFLLLVLISGCGGGGNEGSGQNTTSFVDIHANPGTIVVANVGETAQLDATDSFSVSGATLSYSWSFSYKPHGSNAVLLNPNTATPSFVVDVAGTYMIELIVTADNYSAPRVIALVDATGGSPSFIHEFLPSTCANCHNDSNSNIPSKSQDHKATSNTCQACHSYFAFATLPYIDHLEVFGNCSACHDGVFAVGKSDQHVTTTVECDECHNTVSFLELDENGNYDHSTISRTCDGCHNGVVAIGKHAAHIESGDSCNSCHNTRDFADAYLDHTQPPVTTSRCDSCHYDGRPNVTGKDDQVNPAHIVVGVVVATGEPVDCGVCHTITGFTMGGGFNHRLVDSISQPCESCHNDINFIGKAAKTDGHLDTSSDCGNCHNVRGFLPAYVDHAGPDVVGNRCDSCHVDGSASATGKDDAPNNHMVTVEDCNACHSPGTFTTGFYDHAGIIDNCSSCHDGAARVATGKTANHIPTTADCSACHVIDNFTTFAGITFDHASIPTATCAVCHNGTAATGKKVGHIPTTQIPGDCNNCHANTTSFAITTFIAGAHAGLTANCQECHGTYATRKPRITHIPTVADCSACHVTSTFVGATFNHLDTSGAPITRGCEGCHNGQFTTPPPPATNGRIKGKPADPAHFPTTQDCHNCHTTTAWQPASNFAHTGITDNCASCHNDTYKPLTSSLLFITTDDPDGHPQIPVSNNVPVDCSACHNTTAFAPAFVDHTRPPVTDAPSCASCHDGATAQTFNPATHVATTQDCGLCHAAGGSFVPAIFNHADRVDNCVECHGGTNPTATTKDAKTNPGHITTNEDCSVCHNTTAFAGARFNHQGILDNCGLCHGDSAIGKPNNHVPTNEDCGVCHQTTGFVPAVFDHAANQIVDNCASCHDSGLATGKPNGHVNTNADCGLCHNTNGFIPATFDHSILTNNTRCDSCHVDGSNSATGKDDKTNPAHLPTTLDCRNCHTTATFVGGTWNHGTNDTNCMSCHNGTNARGKSNGHFTTDLQCSVCHSTNGWAPLTFNHNDSQLYPNYPGDHARNPTCADCHGNSITTPFQYPSPQYAPFCAACHAGDFRRQGDHNGGSNGTVEQNKNCGARGCHSVNRREW